MADETPILRFEGISKRFAAVTALSTVSFAIREGECHALVGENGAGKSTLGKIVAGIHQPSSGVMYLRGEPVRLNSPLEAVRAGIGMVHQELCFCPNLTVAENLCLGHLPGRWGFLDRREMRLRARAMLAEMGGDRRGSPIAALRTWQEQWCKSPGVGSGARSSSWTSRPLAGLGEAQRLFELIDRLKARGAHAHLRFASCGGDFPAVRIGVGAADGLLIEPARSRLSMERMCS
jgi:ABC-type Fe3+/spermidine/putrescine transport system ATPase subunit